MPHLAKFVFSPEDMAELEKWEKSDEGKADKRRAKFEEEDEILDAFKEAYPRATGSSLEVEDRGESPDFICLRPNGRRIGVEVTTIRRGQPDLAFWDSVYNHTDEMKPDDTLEEIERLLMKKGKQRLKYRIKRTILVIAVNESDFDLAARLSASVIDYGDLKATGFAEIWLVDMKAIRDGAHREARLFGLYPARHRRMIDRTMWDQKPYG